MQTGIELIAQERQRQIEKEGYTPEHDDKHTDGELADAAIVYALPESTMYFIDEEWGDDMYLLLWPFELKYLKKNDTGDTKERINDLSKAGALIAAEIDRLQREEVKNGDS